MMFKRRQIGILIFTLAISLPIMACLGSIQTFQTPTPLIPTTPPPPTETPIPVATDTPVAVTPAEAIIATQPVAGQVNILEMNSFKDEADYWYFYGLVRNDTDRTIYDLQIEIKLLDSALAEIYTYTTYSMLSYLAPGETSPFSDFTTEPSPDGKTMKATVVGNNSSEAINRAKLEYRGVTLWADDYNDIYLAGEVVNGSADPVEINSIAGINSDYQDSNGDMHLVGAVTNNTTQPMNIYLVAGVYDKDGNCVDANSVYVPIPLNPGTTFPYDFSMWGPMDYVPAAYDAASEYTIFIDWISTYEASSQAYTLTTQDDTNAFDSSSGVFKGTVVNNSGQDLSSAIVIVALYDKVSGDLVATNYSYVTDALEVNTSGSYEVYVYPPNDLDPAEVNIVITAIGA